MPRWGTLQGTCCMGAAGVRGLQDAACRLRRCMGQQTGRCVLGCFFSSRWRRASGTKVRGRELTERNALCPEAGACRHGSSGRDILRRHALCQGGHARRHGSSLLQLCERSRRCLALVPFEAALVPPLLDCERLACSTARVRHGLVCVQLARAVSECRRHYCLQQLLGLCWAVATKAADCAAVACNSGSLRCAAHWQRGIAPQQSESECCCASDALIAAVYFKYLVTERN